MVLKGGISNTVYIWHTEPNACEKCQTLDNQKFYSKDEIPEKPHPNCKCYVEETTEDELCEDCAGYYEQLQDIFKDFDTLGYEVQNETDDIQRIIAQAESITNSYDETLDILEAQYGKHLPDCQYNIDGVYAEIYAQKFKMQILIADIMGLLTPLNTIYDTTMSFFRNYARLLGEYDGTMDKFYHSKANCEAGQRGILGSLTADALSNLKEMYDSFTYIHTHKVSVEEAMADSARDQVANHEGRRRGREYPICDCAILMWDLRPPHKK